MGSIYKGMQELATLNNRLAPYTDNKSQICHELGVHSDYLNLDM